MYSAKPLYLLSMNNDLKKRVNFEIIRYANCWEDADILLEGLSPQPNSRILSVGSAGDNSFSLLATNPALVVAVDINTTQLYLIGLKKACFLTLSYQEMLAFLGFAPCENRLAYFERVKIAIESNEARHYWENNLPTLQEGVIYQGKFEKYFRFFALKILPFIHSRKTTDALLAYKDAEAQALFYRKKWNTWRWRWFFSIFFSKYVMGRYGRDPEFLKWVQVPVSTYIYNKASVHLQSVRAQSNFILRFNLTGSFGDLLPHYLQESNFETIRQNIHKLTIQEGYAQEAITKFGKFDAMNLSNIFEYMDKDLFARTAEELANGLNANGRLAYWNLMVPRLMSEVLPTRLAYQKELSKALTQKDKGFFYNHFFVDSLL